MLIRIVDDDEDLAESLKFLLEPEGWEVVSYPSAEDYLKSDAPSVEGCLLLDIRMPGPSGLELQEKMKERGWEVPIIFLTGHGDVDVAVQAMKFGAYDFLQKPVKAERLIQAISSVASMLKEKRDYGASLEYWYKKFQLLTDRERSITILASQGLLNQEISERLNISTRTVHTHRLNSYKKLDVHSTSDLAPIAALYRSRKITL